MNHAITLKATRKFDKATVMLIPPIVVAAAALSYGAGIPQDSLHTYGRELDPHITIKYGLHSESLPTVRTVMEQFAGGIELSFGPVELFTREEFDVVIVPVESPQLRALHAALSALPNDEAQRPYIPHLTIAYVKKGHGDQYVGDRPINFTQKIPPQIVFSDEHGEKTPLSRNVSSESLYHRALRLKARWLLRQKIKRTLHVAEQNGEAFEVFKDSRGEYRWVSISSNAYRDRDGEIVSLKALTADVARADATGDYGPLRWWHIPGADIGTCDFNAIIGRFLVESGTFKSARIGYKVSRSKIPYQISIGFRHPSAEPDENGVFWNIRRFERSLLPEGRAANPFTSLSIKEIGMNQNEKLNALKEAVGSDLYDQLISKIGTSQKSAEAMGIAFKDKGSTPDLNAMSPAELLEFSVKNYEASAKKGGAGTSDGDGDSDDEKKPANPFAAKMDEMEKKMASMTAKMGEMEKKMAGGESESTKQGSGTNERLTQLEAQNGLLLDTLKALSLQMGDEPAAFKSGNRPSEDDGNVNSDDPNVETKKEAENAFVDFLDFAIPSA